MKRGQAEGSTEAGCAGGFIYFSRRARIGEVWSAEGTRTLQSSTSVHAGEVGEVGAWHARSLTLR